MAWSDLCSDWGQFGQIAAIVYEAQVASTLPPAQGSSQLQAAYQQGQVFFAANPGLFGGTFQSDVEAALALESYEVVYQIPLPLPGNKTVTNVAVDVSPPGSVWPINPNGRPGTTDPQNGSFTFLCAYLCMCQEAGDCNYNANWIPTQEHGNDLNYETALGNFGENSQQGHCKTITCTTAVGTNFKFECANGGTPDNPMIKVTVSGKIDTSTCDVASLSGTNPKLASVIQTYF